MHSAEHTIGIVGYGRFGRALADLADRAGIDWAASDRHNPPTTDRAAPTGADLASRARIIVMCVPVPALERALADLRPHLTPDHLVLDVGSVKSWPREVMARLLGRDIPWCATHPLFGPVSLARNERPLRVIVCPDATQPESARRARELFERLGCEVTEQAADAHDRLMADTHALAFFVARAMLDIGAGQGTELVPPSFRAMAQTVDTVRGDAGHLFSLIQLGNPHAAAARRRLIDALEAIDTELREAADRGSDAGVHQIDPPNA